MNIKQEKTIDHRTMYEGKLLHVYFDEVEISGKTYRREVVSHPGAAAVIPVTKNKEILFVKQYRYPVKRELLEIPAGKLDEAEDPAHCALRELEEETGYIGNIRELGYIYTTPGFSDEKNLPILSRPSCVYAAAFRRRRISGGPKNSCRGSA